MRKRAIAEGVPVRGSDGEELGRIAEREVVDRIREKAERIIGETDGSPTAVKLAMSAPRVLDLDPDETLRMTVQLDAFLLGLDEYHRSRFDEAVADVAGILAAGVPDTDASAVMEAVSIRTGERLGELPELARERFLRVSLEAEATATGWDGIDLADVEELIEQTVAANLSDALSVSTNAVSDFIGEASQVRQTDIGIDSYQWRTRRDDRVRETHAANDGLVFSWDNPPAETGPPGNDWGCRCVAEPDLSEELIASLQAEAEEFLIPAGATPAIHNPANVQHGGDMKRSAFKDPGYIRQHTLKRSDGSRMHVRSMAEPFKVTRQEDEDGFVTIAGYGLKWDTPAELWGEYEQFRRGAFADTLREHVQFFLVEHDYSGIPHARTPDYMTITEDAVGLRFEARLSTRNPESVALIDAVERGLLDKTSIGFSWRNDYEAIETEIDGEEVTLFTFTRIDRLYEISAVKWPVHESSELGTLSRNGARDTVERSRQRALARLKLFRTYPQETR